MMLQSDLRSESSELRYQTQDSTPTDEKDLSFTPNALYFVLVGLMSHESFFTLMIQQQ